MPRAKVNGAEIYYEEAGSGPPLILNLLYAPLLPPIV
jgi:hypothetical protein